MFDCGERLFGVPPGLDFPAVIAEGLRQRLTGSPPEALARLTLWVNSAGMRRRVIAALASHGPVLLPRIRLVTELADGFALPDLPAPAPPLRRKLELGRMIAALIDQDASIAPRSAVFDLADSLADLMDEMSGEGVSPDTLAALDVSAHSEHWARTQHFLAIATRYFGPDLARDAEGRRRHVAGALTALWARTPPSGPQIVLGSTGSRGATTLFMQAVASLPQGVLILPGFDFDMPARVWHSLDDAMTAEDHPQYRYRLLLERLGHDPGHVRPWCPGVPAPAPARNALVSLSLRPAPVTDQWLHEGQALPDLRQTCANVTLIEAPGPRAEAQAIALVMRSALAKGKRAGLITPDRALARHVTAALDRWNILPDDSAGRPLPLTPQGRLLRQVADMFCNRIAGDTLMALLKHPLVHAAEGRGQHLLHSRAFELRLRRHGPAFPGPADVLAFCTTRPGADNWGAWLAACLRDAEVPDIASLASHLERHITLSERLVRGSTAANTGSFWTDDPGREARKSVDLLRAEASAGGEMTRRDYADLFASVLSGGQVRDNALSNPALTIWGSREAREHMPDIMIIGGLNEGIWPQLPPPDPWLNRQMRLQAGLLLPERRIGLMAHDYQQAMGAPQVVLTRAIRSDEAETTPSRWLNRLLNLVRGLPDQHGPQALEDMRARGSVWLAMGRQIDQPAAPVPPAPRPAPAPPVHTRPRELPVTAISTLIRDPYAIYARLILRLKPLDPLRSMPDARLRGSVLHKIMEHYAKSGPHANREAAHAALTEAARTHLLAQVPWPAARLLWQERLDRVAPWFLDFEASIGGTPVVLEDSGAFRFPALDFTLTARPDRIDLLHDGRVHLLDYKTGTPPSSAQRQYFDKQLALTAVILARSGFKGLPLAEVAAATYVGLGATPKVEHDDVSPETIATTAAQFETLIAAYQQAQRGYPSRRAMFKTRIVGDYDHLARHGEWEDSDLPVVLAVPEGTSDA